VIDLHTAVMGVVVGAMLLVLGVFPGLLQGLADGVRTARERFHNELFRNRHLLPPHTHTESEWRAEFKHPEWLAPTGAAVILVALLAYLRG
jgi:hypothetical protein